MEKEKKTELRLKIYPELRRNFHATCVKTGCTMSDVIEGYILDYVKKYDEERKEVGKEKIERGKDE